MSTPPTPLTPDEILALISAHLNRLEVVFSSKSQEISTEIKAVSDGLSGALSELLARVGSISDFQDEIAGIKTQLEDLADAVSANASSVIVLQARLSTLEAKIGDYPKPDSGPVPVPPVIPPANPPATPPTIPSNAVVIPLVVRDISGVDRTSGLVSAGVPIARETALRNVGDLVVLGSNGWPLAGDFRATGFWEDGSIRWVQAVWIDSLGSGESKQYKLIARSGLTNPSPVDRIQAWSSNPELIQVATRASKEENCLFTLSPDSLLDVVDLSSAEGNTNIISSGVTRLKLDTKEGGLSAKPRRIEIEYLGPLVCIVQVETVAESLAFGVQHDNTPGKITVTKRYEFRAGSGIVIVTQALKWEGSKNGTNWQMLDGKTPNAVLGELWADRIELADDPSSVLTALSGSEIVGLDQHGLVTSKFMKAFQDLRPSRTSPRRHIVETGTNSRTLVGGIDKGMMLVSLGERDIAIGIKQMHLHEPCALALNGKTLEIQHASDKFWIPYRSGAYSTCMVAVLDGNENASLDECWAELNHPLRALVLDSSYYSVGELQSVPGEFASYRDTIEAVCTKTLADIEFFGLYGRQTYGSYPRYWGDRDGGDEVGKPEGWDGAYLAALTDYYSTSTTATRLALISGDTKWLDLLSFPAAQRMLHTQIMQSSPEDKWIYDGWAPAGYQFYRQDFNSSHSYFEGVYWYYLLTGDRQTIDILTKGCLRMTEWLMQPSQEVVGRAAHQHAGCARFLSMCHYSPAMREKFRKGFVDLCEKAIRQCYFEGVYKGEKVYLWRDGIAKNFSPNLYAFAIWDMESLWWYGKILSANNPSSVRGPMHPWTILTNLALTTIKYGAQIVGGTGKFSASGADKWARGFAWDIVPGTTDGITNLRAHESGGETLLYKGDEPGMAAWFVRAAEISKDPLMIATAKNLVEYSIASLKRMGKPLGKISGLGDCRLGEAVAELPEFKVK